MKINSRYGVKEATRDQRRTLSERVAALNATQGRKLSLLTEQLSQRYVAGELSLTEIHVQLDGHYQTVPTAVVN